MRTQSEHGLRNHLLIRLDNEKSKQGTSQHLPTLEERLAGLVSARGYDRLGCLLRKASSWDEYQEVLAQIDITLFFKRKGLLNEIEPELPHRTGNADILISFSSQDIYCEVTSFQSILKSIETKQKSEEGEVQKRPQEIMKGQPWKTEQDIEHEREVGRIVRNLLDKTKRQLPPNRPGILALETGKSAIFGFDVRIIARRLFPKRRQIALIMLWSWENSGGDDSDLTWKRDKPSFCFINPGSQFRKVGETLLQQLGLTGEVVGI